ARSNPAKSAEAIPGHLHGKNRVNAGPADGRDRDEDQVGIAHDFLRGRRRASGRLRQSGRHFSFAGGGTTTGTGGAHSIGRDARSTDPTFVDGKFPPCPGRRVVRHIARGVGPEGFASFGPDGSAAHREFLSRLDGAAVCRRSDIYRRALMWTGARVAAFPIRLARRTRIERTRVNGRKFAVPAPDVASVQPDCARGSFARERWPAVTKLYAVERRTARVRLHQCADDPVFVAANRI